MPPVDKISGLAEGLGDAFGNFSRALASVMQHQQSRARSSRQRQREDLIDRLELAATPGVSLGEPPTVERPSRAQQAEEATVEGAGAVRSPLSAGGPPTVVPRPELPEEARTTEVPSDTAQRLGRLGEEPVYYDPEAARRSTTEPILKPVAGRL